MATCALCRQDRKLCKSHILPELFYKNVYDENPKRFFTVSTDPSHKPMKRQKGIWEYLLCEECEGKISHWENYAARMFFQEATVAEKPGRLEVLGLDYSKFKLFQLSVLWRAGVSRRTEFSDLTLGPHEERIRKMLLSDEPGPPEKYGCLMLICPTFKKELQRMIILPDVVRTSGYHICRFLLAGLFWNYFTSNHKPPVTIGEFGFLNKEGTLPIIVEEVQTSRYLRDVNRRWKESGNLDYVLDKDVYEL